MSLKSRLAKIEAAAADAARPGWRGVRTFDSAIGQDGRLVHWERLSPGYDYAEAVLAISGTLPTDRPLYSDADLERLRADGWELAFGVFAYELRAGPDA